MNTCRRTCIVLSLIGVLTPSLPAQAQNGYQTRANRPSMVDTTGLPATQFYHGQRHADIVDEGIILHECRRQAESAPNLDGMSVPPLPPRARATTGATRAGVPDAPNVSFDNPMVGGLNTLPASRFQSNIAPRASNPATDLSRGDSVGVHSHMAAPARRAAINGCTAQPVRRPISSTPTRQLASYQDNVHSIGTGSGSGSGVAQSSVHGVIKKLLEKAPR